MLFRSRGAARPSCVSCLLREGVYFERVGFIRRGWTECTSRAVSFLQSSSPGSGLFVTDRRVFECDSARWSVECLPQRGRSHGCRGVLLPLSESTTVPFLRTLTNVSFVCVCVCVCVCRMWGQFAGEQWKLFLARLPERLLSVHALHLEDLCHSWRKGTCVCTVDIL